MKFKKLRRKRYQQNKRYLFKNNLAKKNLRIQIANASYRNCRNLCVDNLKKKLKVKSRSGKKSNYILTKKSYQVAINNRIVIETAILS